jgi:hypothetical protein
MYDRCIVLYLRVLIQPLSTGDRNNLEQRRREDVEKAREVVRDEPSTLQSVKDGHIPGTSTRLFVGPQAVTVCFNSCEDSCRDALPSAFLK